jgi:hypothetical protein
MRTTTTILLATLFATVLTLAPAQAHAQTAAAAPVVHGTFPKSGPVGSLVLVFGDNFSADPTKDAVTFNGVAAVVSFARVHALAVVVPAGATTGPVAVTVGGAASNTVPFTITVATPPTLTALVPAQGPVGTPVVIQGTGLGGNWNTFFGGHHGFGPGGFGFGSNSSVTFGTTTAHAFFTDTAVYTFVPAGLAVSTVPVTVTINGVASNALPFNVEATPPPTLATLNPVTGPVGTIVTISGTGLQPHFGSFGHNQNPFAVSFNGTAAGFGDILSVTSQSVVCLVPVGATTGPVTVTVSGTASNALPFTVTPAGPPVLTTVTAKVVGQAFGAAGNVFVSFKLEGTGLGNQAQRPTLVVNGAAVPGGVRFVSDTEVEAFASLPGPAPVSGTIALTVNAVTSNALPFTAQ